MSTDIDLAQVFYDLSQIDFVRIAAIIAVVSVLYVLMEHLVPRGAERVRGRIRLRILPWVPVLRLIVVLYVAS